jgi:hypothetical protein
MKQTSASLKSLEGADAAYLLYKIKSLAEEVFSVPTSWDVLITDSAGNKTTLSVYARGTTFGTPTTPPTGSSSSNDSTPGG